MATPAPASFAAAALAEPYRVMFPLGFGYLIAALGIVIIDSSSATIATHMTLASLGFLGCFVAGFIQTMLPRLLDCGPLPAAWPITIAVLACSGIGLLVVDQLLLLATFELLLFGALLGLAARCLLGAKRRPPPRMALAAVGLLCGLGAAATTLATLSGAVLPLWLETAARAVLSQGVLLLLVTAFAGFMVPRLADGARAEPACMAPPTVKLSQAPWFAALGLIVILTFIGQAWASTDGASNVALRANLAVRAAIVIPLLGPALFLRGRQPAYLRICQCAVWSICLGLIMLPIMPQYLMAWYHLIFINGFLLLTLIIAARVATAHAGHRQRLEEREGRWLWLIMGLVSLG
ncbi:MAG: NnrS family protein, partial [Planctomycetota bacterium]